MTAQPKLGSGDRFRALSAQLAAKGASNPDALAAWIGRRKYGAKKMGGLSHANMSNGGLLDILLADNTGSVIKCPHCGYKADSAQFEITGGASGTSDPAAPSALLTPAGGDLDSAGMSGTQGVNVANTGKVKGALSNTGRRSIQLSEPLAPRLAVTGPYDFIVNRSSDDPSVAVVRHRRGGDEIGRIRHTDTGDWAGVFGGQELNGHTRQRAALIELLSVHNRSVLGNGRPMALQSAPAQTPLMARYGIPAVRALATPATGAGNGPRITTMASGDGDGSDDTADTNGLTPKGQAIYKRLLAKGFPAARALSFAKNAQNMKSGSFKKAS